MIGQDSHGGTRRASVGNIAGELFLPGGDQNLAILHQCGSAAYDRSRAGQFLAVILLHIHRITNLHIGKGILGGSMHGYDQPIRRDRRIRCLDGNHPAISYCVFLPILIGLSGRPVELIVQREIILPPLHIHPGHRHGDAVDGHLPAVASRHDAQRSIRHNAQRRADIIDRSHRLTLHTGQSDELSVQIEIIRIDSGHGPIVIRNSAEALTAGCYRFIAQCQPQIVAVKIHIQQPGCEHAPAIPANVFRTHQPRCRLILFKAFTFLGYVDEHPGRILQLIHLVGGLGLQINDHLQPIGCFLPGNLGNGITGNRRLHRPILQGRKLQHDAPPIIFRPHRIFRYLIQIQYNAVPITARSKTDSAQCHGTRRHCHGLTDEQENHGRQNQPTIKKFHNSSLLKITRL